MARVNISIGPLSFDHAVYDAEAMPYRKVGEREAVEEHTEVLSEGYKVDNVKGKIALDVAVEREGRQPRP